MRKRLLLLALALPALLAIDPAARDVKSVYILRMANGLDQFVASELAQSGVYTVTTDPQLADALITDSLGEGFEKKFTELYPPPDAEKDGESKEGALDSGVQRIAPSSWGRGKGTVFLVDRKSRTLLWSMNRQPKNTSTPEIVKQARKIVERLAKDLGVAPAK